MSPILISFLVFISAFVFALLAMRLRAVLPTHHLSDDTKNTVKITMGLVATMVALVLGLLVASTKESYDDQKNEITQTASKIIYLDSVLANFGPAATETRELLRDTVETAIARVWPEDTSKQQLQSPPVGGPKRVSDSIKKLTPQNDAQIAAKNEALQLATDLGQIRWLLFVQADTSSISMPMLIIVICWLAILFFSFGLFAPGNGTAIGALMLAALSVATATFLILELDRPFSGFIQISGAPLHYVLSLMGK